LDILYRIPTRYVPANRNVPAKFEIPESRDRSKGDLTGSQIRLVHLQIRLHQPGIRIGYISIGIPLLWAHTSATEEKVGEGRGGGRRLLQLDCRLR